MNLKETIARAHYLALNGVWLYDEPSCETMRVVGHVESDAERPPDRLDTGYRLSLLRGGREPQQRRGERHPSYRVFIVEDAVHEGRIAWTDDPFLPRFRDAIILGHGAYREELEGKLAASIRWERVPDKAWLDAVLALPLEARDVIMADPRMADCPADYWSLGGIVGSSTGATLGGWLSLWYGDGYAWRCPDCGARVLIYAGGCGLSGGSMLGRCTGCGQDIHTRDGVVSSMARALRILSAHAPAAGARRPYRIDTVLNRLGAAVATTNPANGRHTA